MSHAYQMPDGEIVFVSVAEGHEPPTQEAMEAQYAAMKQRAAERDPACIDYGAILQRALRARGVTLREASNYLGISAAEVSRIFQGYRFPDKRESHLIVDLLNKPRRNDAATNRAAFRVFEGDRRG